MTTETIKVKQPAELLAEEIYVRWRNEANYRLSPLHAEWVVKWLAAALSALIERQAAKLVVEDSPDAKQLRRKVEVLTIERDEWRAKAKRATATIASYHAQASHRARKLGTPEEAEEKKKRIKELKRQVEALTDKLHAANMIASNLRVDNDRLRRARNDGMSDAKPM